MPPNGRSYLAIITAETARLTRLINNVLDFSRMERGEKKYHFENGDLTALAQEIAANYRPHLEAAGFAFELRICPLRRSWRGPTGMPLRRCCVNLISNAEKYSGEKKEITLRLRALTQPVAMGEISVLDRGPGVRAGARRRFLNNSIAPTIPSAAASRARAWA